MIKWSKKFAQKFLSFLPYYNKQLKDDRQRIVRIGSAEERPDPKPRLAKVLSSGRWQNMIREETHDDGYTVSGLQDTDSMNPVMDSGHHVIVHKITPRGRWSIGNIQVGDIITFWRYDGQHVIHRVIKIQKTAKGDYLFETLGDNLVWSDGATHQDDITGILAGIIY